MLFCAEASCCSSDFQSGDKSCTVRTLPETRYQSDADSMQESYRSEETEETTKDSTSFMEMNVFFMNAEDRTKFSTSCQEVELLCLMLIVLFLLACFSSGSSSRVRALV